MDMRLFKLMILKCIFEIFHGAAVKILSVVFSFMKPSALKVITLLRNGENLSPNRSDTFLQNVGNYPYV